MKQHYCTFSEQAFNLLAEQTGPRAKKLYYMQMWRLDKHLSWLRKPRDYCDVTNLNPRQTLESYDGYLVEKMISDLMMAVLRLQD
jgi:hypothetical protein